MMDYFKHTFLHFVATSPPISCISFEFQRNNQCKNNGYVQKMIHKHALLSQSAMAECKLLFVRENQGFFFPNVLSVIVSYTCING